MASLAALRAKPGDLIIGRDKFTFHAQVYRSDAWHPLQRLIQKGGQTLNIRHYIQGLLDNEQLAENFSLCLGSGH